MYQGKPIYRPQFCKAAFCFRHYSKHLRLVVKNATPPKSKLAGLGPNLVQIKLN
jgi:hypothetical protein